MGGCEGRRCETRLRYMLAYGRIGAPLESEIAGGETHYNGDFQVVLGGLFIDISIIWGEGGGSLWIYQSFEPSNPNPCFAR